MIRTGALFGNHAGRPGLELAILDNGKAYTPPIQMSVIGSDTPLDGRRVVRVGQMAGLSTLHLLDVFDGHGISTVGSSSQSRFLPVVPPNVGLSHIMIIGNGHGREVLDHLSEIPAEPQPGRVMATMVVNLVAGKEKKVGLKFFDILDQVLLRDIPPMTGIDGISGESDGHEFPLILGVLADYPFIGRLLPMPNSVWDLLRIIPLLYPKGNGPTPLDHLGLGYLFPVSAKFDFQDCLA